MEKDDILPDRFFEDPLAAGMAKGKLINREDFEKMLLEYYKISGWTAQGIPTKEKLLELGLTNAARDIYKDDK